MRMSDWSSDVCSSDLQLRRPNGLCPIKLPSPPPRIAGPPTGKKLSPMHWPAPAHGGIIRNHLDSRKPLSMNAAKRAQIFARLQAADPHPTTELEYEIGRAHV